MPIAQPRVSVLARIFVRVFSHHHQIEALHGIIHRGSGLERYEVWMRLAAPIGWSVFFTYCHELRVIFFICLEKILNVPEKCRRIKRKYATHLKHEKNPCHGNIIQWRYYTRELPDQDPVPRPVFFILLFGRSRNFSFPAVAI